LQGGAVGAQRMGVRDATGLTRDLGNLRQIVVVEQPDRRDAHGRAVAEGAAGIETLGRVLPGRALSHHLEDHGRAEAVAAPGLDRVVSRERPGHMVRVEAARGNQRLSDPDRHGRVVRVPAVAFAQGVAQRRADEAADEL